MDDEPIRCPECEQITLMPIRAAEIPGPLLYGCGNCSIILSPEELVFIEEPTKPKSLLERLRGALHAE